MDNTAVKYIYHLYNFLSQHICISKFHIVMSCSTPSLAIVFILEYVLLNHVRCLNISCLAITDAHVMLLDAVFVNKCGGCFCSWSHAPFFFRSRLLLTFYTCVLIWCQAFDVHLREAINPMINLCTLLVAKTTRIELWYPLTWSEPFLWPPMLTR